MAQADVRRFLPFSLRGSGEGSPQSLETTEPVAPRATLYLSYEEESKVVVNNCILGFTMAGTVNDSRLNFVVA